MLGFQEVLPLSPYYSLYEILVPKDNLLRQMKELIDFNFIYDLVMENYSTEIGRLAVDPVQMFKYILLKEFYNLSDRDLIERASYDLSFKFFLDLMPEDKVIAPTSLTKFRTLRLKNTDILNGLINDTVKLAIEHGILNESVLYVDSTHTSSRFNAYSPQSVLYSRAKALRKAIYQLDESAKESMPPKIEEDNVTAAIQYTQTLVDWVAAHPHLSTHPSIEQPLNYLKENLEEDVNHLRSAKELDAKIGHKSADSSFYGFKTHYSMTAERIIVACVVTSGEKSDSEQFKPLYKKSVATGFKIDSVVGDSAYSSMEIQEHLHEENVQLISKVNPVSSQGNRKPNSIAHQFTYNKDSDMYHCPAGHQAIRKSINKRKKKSARLVYHYDVEKCKQCPLKEHCYQEGAKSKSFSITLHTELRKKQIAFEETDEFKQRYKKRYKIEAKNSELKTRHGFKKTKYVGLFGMELQAAVSIFAVNMKRIIKLLAEKKKNNT